MKLAISRSKKKARTAPLLALTQSQQLAWVFQEDILTERAPGLSALHIPHHPEILSVVLLHIFVRCMYIIRTQNI